MTTTIKLPIEFDDLMSAVFGSGALSTYWWYNKVIEFHELGPAFMVFVAIGEEGESLRNRLIDERVLAEVIEDIVEHRKPGWETVLHGAVNDDFDADAGDIVLQYAVLGELVWG